LPRKYKRLKSKGGKLKTSGGGGNNPGPPFFCENFFRMLRNRLIIWVLFLDDKLIKEQVMVERQISFGRKIERLIETYFLTRGHGVIIIY